MFLSRRQGAKKAVLCFQVGEEEQRRSSGRRVVLPGRR